MLSRSLFPSRNTTHHHPLLRSRPPGIRSSRRFDQISGNNWLVAWPLNSSANLAPRISSTPAKQLPFRAKQQQEKSCFSSKEISLQLCAPFLSLKFIAIFVKGCLSFLFSFLRVTLEETCHHFQSRYFLSLNLEIEKLL